MLERLNRQYEIQTLRTKKEIFDEIARKALIQKDSFTFIPTNDINYKEFKVDNDRIEIELWPNILNPFRRCGTIYFDFQSLETGTKIKATIETYSKYGILGGGCLLFFFLTLFSALVLYFANDSFLKVFMFILFAWLVILIPLYLAFRFSTNSLELYSKKILNDLNLKT